MKTLKLLLILCCLSFPACLSSVKTSESNAEPPKTETTVDVPNSAVDLAKPLVLSTDAKDVELGKKLEEIIEKSEFRHANWGFFVASLKDGRVLCAKNGQQLFNPASTLKLITTSVALDKLGADFRWRTSIYTTVEPKNGEVNGDLILYGHGAPDFDSAKLSELAEKLQLKGIKRIKGDLIGDDSYFRADALGDGWTWGEAQWYYGAEPSALTFNENQIEVRVDSNGVPSLAPTTNYANLKSDLKQTEAGKLQTIGVNRGLENNEIYVWGDAPHGQDFAVKIAVHEPENWAIGDFKKELEKRGITVEGNVKALNWKTSKFVPEKSVELVSVESATLGEIIRKTLKDSVNLNAELILRTLGKQFGKDAPDENPKINALRGDDAAGAAVVKKWLKEKGIATDEISIHDGSGLSRLDFIAPETLGKLLIFASQMKNAEIFKNSLPIAGTDGTLRGRLANASGKVFAKTGTISYISALAGYAKSSNGETLAFSIFCNGETLKSDSNKTIDDLVNLLVK